MIWRADAEEDAAIVAALERVNSEYPDDGTGVRSLKRGLVLAELAQVAAVEFRYGLAEKLAVCAAIETCHAVARAEP